MNKEKQELIAGLAWAGVMLALALGAIFARKLGYIDRDTVMRVVIGVNGLMIAWYGNRMPKTFVPSAGTQGPGGSRAGPWCWAGSSMPDCGRSRRSRWRYRAGAARSWRDRGDARLLPVAAGQGERRLIQAFFEARQRRRPEGRRSATIDATM